jgi:hypothetical protein
MTRHPATPTDAQMRARALSRWEGEGGALGQGASAGDALDESELRILARIGAATAARVPSVPPRAA